MGKFNEIQEQVTQSWGGNSFTTTIKDNTVEFDSAKDKFTFKDPVEVPSINVGGTESVPFSAEDKAKLDNLQTPMQIKGRVDSVSDLPTEDVSVGDTYLVGVSGSETFDEYVCTGFAGSPEEPVWESVGTTQVQADWDQNDNTKADYIKNRTHYVEVSMTTVFNDDVTVTSMQQDDLYLYQGLTGLAEDFEIEEGQTYKVTKDGVEYEIVATEFNYTSAIIYGNLEQLEAGSFGIFTQAQLGGTVELGVMGISSSEVSSVSLKIDAPTETVHQLDDKYISDNIARVANLPTQVFIKDETNNGIITNGSYNQSAAEGNCILGSSYNSTVTGYGNTVIGTTGSGPSNITGGNGNTILGSGGSVTLTNASQCFVVGTANTQIAAGGTKCSAIGGGLSISTEGVQGAVRIGGYGGDGQAVLNSSGAFCIGGSGMGTVGDGTGSSSAPGSGFIGHCGYGSSITKPYSIVIGGDGQASITGGSANIIMNSSGGASISVLGSYKSIIGCSGVSIAGSGSMFCSTLLSTAGGNITATNQNDAINYSIISGGSGNYITANSGSVNNSAIVGGQGNTVSNCSNSVILGGSGITATESNTVYVPTLKATTGVSTKKLTISSIDPADVFMHSEIIDASSDVTFSRTIASSSSTKTDGYVEILYKASSGVTCSAYIDSTDVSLTADGAWHKLEQGCDPADGVEIHINNSAPVTDATLEVISKVYYI